MTQVFDAIVGSQSGTKLAADLTDWRSTLLSGHGGLSRPSYAMAGTLWYKTDSCEVYFFDGVNDAFVGKIDTINHAFVPPIGGGAATLASASTTDLASVAAAAITVTGTTTITALGVSPTGIIKVMTFADVLTLTHNSTSLRLPGGADIATAAGDVAIMLSIGSGSWRCVSYMRVSGDPASSVHGFSASFNSTFTATNKITGWTEAFDAGSNFNASTGRFTAPLSGYYRVSFSSLNIFAPSVGLTIALYKNGSAFAPSAAAPAVSFAGCSTSTVIHLTAGDYLELFVTTGTAHSDAQYNNFSVDRIR